jgi:DNA repair protein RecO (recombination protein O)
VKKRASLRPSSGPVADRALVLRRFRFGESSLVAHLLTPGHGRVAVLAKGAYRLKSGFCGVLDLFDTLAVSWKPQSSELALLRSAALVRRRRTVPLEPERYRSALCVLEVAGLGARAGAGEPALFALAEEALDGFAAGRTHPLLVRTAFDLAFLREAGLAPALEGCAACGAVPTVSRGTRGGGRAASVPFSVASGGRLCARCAQAARSSGRKIESVPLQWLRIASSLMASSVTALERVRLEEDTCARILAFVERFLEHHLESRPRSFGRAPAPPRAGRARVHHRTASPPR